jgi:hypothetical protein
MNNSYYQIPAGTEWIVSMPINRSLNEYPRKAFHLRAVLRILYFCIIAESRTRAKLGRKSGRDLEQIKFLPGHSSIQTTERYLGSDQEVPVAVNDMWSL